MGRSSSSSKPSLGKCVERLLQSVKTCALLSAQRWQAHMLHCISCSICRMVTFECQIWIMHRYSISRAHYLGQRDPDLDSYSKCQQ